MTLLGIDYGLVHIGVAIAYGPLAQPLTTLSTKSAFSDLIKLISTHHVSSIIIGLPEGRLAGIINNFVSDLRQLGYDVSTHSETLSSKDAVASLTHTTRSRRKSLEHSAAAAIILQSWLDSHPPTS
jgi:putative transcription antitermination factor YqgF